MNTIILLFLISSSVLAGPYGLESGMRLKDVIIDNDIDINVKELKPPHPDNEISTYFGTFGIRAGLCKIVAVGNDIETDLQGKKLKYQFNQMEKKLTDEYGRPTVKYDLLHEQSKWTTINGWTNGLLISDRQLVTVYDLSTEFNTGIGVVLEALAKTPTIGYLLISYEFGNIKGCIREIQWGESLYE
jgi:hypothetical protein